MDGDADKENKGRRSRSEEFTTPATANINRYGTEKMSVGTGPGPSTSRISVPRLFRIRRVRKHHTEKKSVFGLVFSRNVGGSLEPRPSICSKSTCEHLRHGIGRVNYFRIDCTTENSSLTMRSAISVRSESGTSMYGAIQSSISERGCRGRQSRPSPYMKMSARGCGPSP